MFNKNVYVERRRNLKKLVKTGLILLLGNEASPVNYTENKYPFRQDSTFLYYFGLSIPNAAAVIDVENDTSSLFLPVLSRRERLWNGPEIENSEIEKKTGIQDIQDINVLYAVIREKKRVGVCLHYLPTYSKTNERKLSELTGLHPQKLLPLSSKVLILAVLSQRLRKDVCEVNEIRKALEVSRLIFNKVKPMIKPGVSELEILSVIEGYARLQGCRMASEPIVTVKGQYLHNTSYGNILKDGDILLIDFGVETNEGYCSDITRCYPVSGKFSGIERELYQLVYEAQQNSLNELSLNVSFMESYLKSAETLSRGLLELGILKGTIEEIMKQRAFALFYPHGLGHMMGLDQHDLEGVFKEYCSRTRMANFRNREWLNAVRMRSPMKPGYVLTMEPGLYFNKEEINECRRSSHLAHLINYQRLKDLNIETGFRIEDNVLITESGYEILSKDIPIHFE